MPNCLSCQDTGSCPFCHGSGKDNNAIICNYCKGSGRCIFCSSAPSTPQAPMAGQPVYQQPQFGAQPNYPQAPMAGQPVYQQPQFGAQPNYPQGTMAGQPVYQQPQFGSQPNYPQAPMAGQPVYQQPQTENQQSNSSIETKPPRPVLDKSQIQQYMNAYRKIASQNEYWQPLSGSTPGEHFDDLLGQAMSSSKMTRFNATSAMSWMAKYGGMAIPPLLPYFMYTIKYGTDRERVGVCRLIEKLEDFSESFASILGESLTHPSHSLRLQAAETLAKMKKHAVPAEKYLLEAAKSNSSQQIQKLATEALKNFRKLSKEEKDEIQRNEEQSKKLIEETKKIEKQVASMKVDLPKGVTELSQYKNIFFMSHALPDFPWVKKVIDEISTWPGCYCWTCERDISPGEDWLTEIYKGLEACNWYLLFWSNEAEKSKWTNEEIREAKTRNVSSGKPRLSVVNLGKDQWPLLLNRAQGAMVKSDAELQQYLINLKTQVGL